MVLHKYIGGKVENRVGKEIGKIKKRINNLVLNENKNIIDAEVVNLSQKLDDLLIYYIRTSKEAC
ncbi:aspartyl-phosphate phosphatase Spo0E family protein [Clostridium ganghwense]|uniref:Aspartyl-phosphate phosphatase Spo0E family protein n=1 Tax=Clostridium ganghwense TaxID=312089 RepID=A0ABT4CIZ6_9CLOT|nr:aspartyl-phosphate phosphatase Spo0E family protein [Clostridium ganghwense]MCY6369036.1 aspartyl-phosphate phosphatase Spo0E family protein [Clostridium ganghwense]